MHKQRKTEAEENKTKRAQEETMYRNLSGFTIKPVYGPEDVSGFDANADLGLPGEYPFTRGVYETMYRGRPWTIRQLGSLDSPSGANARIRQLIEMGATGISICLDLPTIMGRVKSISLSQTGPSIRLALCPFFIGIPLLFYRNGTGSSLC